MAHGRGDTHCRAARDTGKMVRCERRAIAPPHGYAALMADDDLPEGLSYVEDFISEDEEQSLLTVLDAMEFHELTMRGQTARRTVRHFGLGYAYESGEVAPTDPLPEELAWLRERCAALIERDAEDLVQVLVTRYPEGAGIGWHRDAPMFGSRIAGVSLRAPCRMRFQRTLRGERSVAAIELAPRSAYVLSGKARWSWQHSIPATKDLRYSMTFRTLRRG
jgi:alkylated DNA repair protein (DNA oxidative demethylase)